MKQHQILAIETKQHADEGTLIEHPSSVTNNAVLFTNRSVFDFNCNALIKGDKNEIHKYITYVKNDNVSKLTDVSTKYGNLTSNCTHFVTHRGYITDAFTEEEKQFPIAFSILIHTEVKQAETLLRAIYRPQNLYCIHVDTKSSAAFYEEILAISSCFDNVFLSSQRFDVKWGTMSVLEPEIECMKDLWNKSVSWKYFINLTGQEIPLRTNLELVKILKAYNGAVHIAASRGYVDYLLHDQRAKDLLEWTRKTDIPDETYFSTLNANPHLNVPGSYNGDLPGLAESEMLFANKFFLDFQPLARECLDELLNNRTREEYLGNLYFNDSFYAQQDFVINQAGMICFRIMVNTERLSSAGPAPHNIRPSKGAVHIAASRGYVDYLLHDQRAKDLLEWTRKTDIPDETYFSTLNSNPHLNVPGSYNGDLPGLAESEMLFANKFFLDFQPLARECLDELLNNRTREEHLGNLYFNDSFYAQQDFVINQ
ncbi:GCNT1-like protein, partial [Mya arenaria]